MHTNKSISQNPSKFEQDLQVYFPDLYKFWSLFKFDPFMEEVLSGILDMVNTDAYGKIEIVYNKGKINYVNQQKQLTAQKSHKVTKIVHRQIEYSTQVSLTKDPNNK